MVNDFLTVTEIAGDKVSQEQMQRLYQRYYWAGTYCKDKDVLEAACGTGQGLGYLMSVAKSVNAGDYSDKILKIARKHYGNRIQLKQFDAQNMPFPDNSMDVVILFEAIYYIPSAEKFLLECKRVLRRNGKVLIATANKDLYDFNPSPYTYKYYGTVELWELFTKYGFEVELLGSHPVDSLSIRQRILRPVKKMIVALGLMPRSSQGKKLLKRLVFGKLMNMPAEIKDGIATTNELSSLTVDVPDRKHKVLYCTATLN